MDVQSTIDLMSKITSTNHSDEMFENNLKSVLALDQSSGCSNTCENKNIRFMHVTKTIELLFRLKDMKNLMLNTNQKAIVSKCLDFVVSLGFIPCLILRVLRSFDKNQKNVIQSIDETSKNLKYEGLKFVVNSFMELIKEPTFKILILTKYTNILLAGLCQLSLLPIAKPGTDMALKSSIDEFKYEELKNEQDGFKNVLDELILIERDPLIIREIIFTLGHKNCEKHLKRGLEKIFTDLLIQSNGIQTLLRIACDLNSETSQKLQQCLLEKWSNLIHSYYLNSKTKYIKYIVPQIWELLRSNSRFYQIQFQSVAMYCVYLISIENYTDFLKLYVNPIELSLKRCKYENNENVSKSIEDLHTLFYLFRNEIWSLNPKLLANVAMTIYNIYVSTASSIYYLKSKLEDLVFLILIHFSCSKDHFKQIIFSQHEIVVQFVDQSADIQFKYIERKHQFDLESQAELVLKLIDKRGDLELMKKMVITLLDMYTDVSSYEYSIFEKFFIIKSIQHLTEKENVQKSLSSNPEMILNLTKSILKEMSEKDVIDTQVLSVVLNVLNCVLYNMDEKYFNQLECLMDYLNAIFEMVKEEDVFRILISEMKEQIVRVLNTSVKKPVTDQRTIDDILYETRDPLLPIRAHALIELKKKIESGDEVIYMNKSTILIVIQENLKNADSYLYLSAVYALSALCSYFPNDILPILCEEYSVPVHYNHSTETRLKIGEVLMKTVKLLNETIPLHKNRLLNAFLAGVKDDDNLVRVSSLSNLAEVCRLLRYNLGSVVAEIVNCADYVLRYDPAIECRRAAVFLLQNIIQGADSELIEILADSIKEIYNMLKSQYLCGKDEIVQLHSQIAIESLNDIMKSLFLNEKK